MRRLSEIARHVVVPSEITATGWPAVRDKCRDLGVTFDDWQDGAGRLILAKRKDGKLAAMIGGIGMSLPRQVGKTYLLGALLFALAILRPGLLVIWTAHHSRTSSETFLSMQGFARRRRIAPYIQAVYKGSGDEAVVFRNGSRILFGARERGFGRGIPGVDVLMCDEAQILTDRALDNMLATLNTSSLGLAIYVGTPPRPEDPSEAFQRMRTEALSGEAEDMVWIECGADPGAMADDRDQWAKANPSFPDRTPVESILRLRKKLTLDSFMREGLGIWDESGLDVFGVGNWEACAAQKPVGLPVSFFGLAATLDMTHCSIVAAGVERDLVHVKPLQHGPGSHWVVQRLAEMRQKPPVVIDRYGPAAPLIPHIEAAGFEVVSADTHDVLDSCAKMLNLVRDRKLRHANYPELNLAIRGAVRREVRDRWAWGRKQSTSDVSTLEAATLAAWRTSLPLETKKPPASPLADVGGGHIESDSFESVSF
jgi:hypothetical protein